MTKPTKLGTTDPMPAEAEPPGPRLARAAAGADPEETRTTPTRPAAVCGDGRTVPGSGPA